MGERKKGERVERSIQRTLMRISIWRKEHPGEQSDRFRSLGKEFYTKPNRPEPNDAPPLRIARILKHGFPDQPMFLEDAFRLMERGLLTSAGKWTFKGHESHPTFVVTLEGLAKFYVLEKAYIAARRAGADLE